jgi:type I restriction enzyme S subunit
LNALFPMRRLCDVGVALHDCEHRTPKPASGGYAYIAIPDIKDGRLDLSSVRRISEPDYLSWTRKTKPQPGDIILTRRGRVGDTAVVPPGLECAIGQNLVILRSDGSRVDQRFLRWALRGPLYDAEVHKYLNVGAVFSSLNCRHIPLFEIPVPSITDQRRIAGVLEALDDKIEHNSRIGGLLEDVGRLQFDATIGRLLQAGAKPDALPAAWSIAVLREIFEINPPRRLKVGTNAPYLDMKNMPTIGHFPVDWYDRPAGSGARFTNGDTLVARITPCLENGKTAFVDFLRDDAVGWGSTEYIVLRPMSPLPAELAYFLARHDNFRDYAIRHMSGSSGRQRVSTDAIGGYVLPVPDDGTLRELGQQLAALLAAIRVRRRENRTLTAIGNALLPKLVSGQIRVPDSYDPDDVLGTVAEEADATV